MKLNLFLVAISISALFSPTLRAEIPVYGVIIDTADSAYREAVEDGLRQGATIEKADIYLQTLESNSADQMVSLCNNMLDRKPNVLLITTADATTLTSCLDKAGKLDIPVVAISDSTEAFQNKHITSVVLADEADNPHMVGLKAIEQAAQVIKNQFSDGA